MNQQKKIIIAIDGYSSCGKSTMAKAMAKILQYSYIDTGAMYRAVTLYALQNKLVLNNQVLASELVKHLGQIEISFRFNVNTQQSDTYLNGKNVESEIRGMEVASFVSPVATIKEVREAMVLQQQAMGIEKGIVMDGRDIGTVVFPDAELKIFMTADPEIRAKRRFDEMQARGEAASYESILANVLERDHIDRSRAESPLMQAADALVLDNSYLSQTEQLDWSLLQVKRILNDN